jgi:pimeloyl-ACP methyl ester carboxylesterase
MVRINAPSSWQQLLDALDSGKIDQIRTAVGALDERGEEMLSEHIGGARVERARRTVRRSRETQRRATGGRVIVIHGIMGAQLDVVDKDGDSDRVWVNYLRLFNGRIADLELLGGVQPKNPAINVRVAGIFPEYVPLLLELDQCWKVSPFAYDWRLDIDDSAAKLADLVKTWAAGEPCHIVAHSMGGLVARRFMRLFPDVWKTMVDPNGRKRGGRLIQLGTPNRGSFAIPLMLTGNEPLVRKLAVLDRRHDVKDILPVLATFPGSYQMMPAPAGGSDDRNKLYQVGTWGTTRPIKEFLDLGSRFHKAMETIVDPEGIVYVAATTRKPRIA